MHDTRLEEPGTTPPPSGWRILLDAVRGVHMDYTTAPMGQAIVMLAVPMVMEMIMESIFAVVDVFWVAHLGANAVATIGLTESMLTIVYTVAMGVSIGAMALVARRIGEKAPDAASRTAVQGIVLGLVIAAIVGVIGAFNAERLLRAMGATDEIVATGSGFTRIMLGGNVTIVLLFLINAVFRGAGDAAIAMRVLWFANILKIVLGPCFIFGLGPFPELGVTGAAVATNIGRGTGVVYAFSKLIRSGGRFDLRREHVRLEPAIMARLISLSSTATFQVF